MIAIGIGINARRAGKSVIFINAKELMDKEKESIFFQVIYQSYEKSFLIITTNPSMRRWDEVFTGQLAAKAILDRLVHHFYVPSITGDSFRVKGAIYKLRSLNRLECLGFFQSNIS